MHHGEMYDAVKTVELSEPVISLERLEEDCDSEELKSLLDDLKVQSIRYAETVAEFIKTDIGTEDRVEADANRTRIHNATMDAINILARNLKKAGKDNSWIEKLPHRANKGLFALQIAFTVLRREVEKGIQI